MGQGCEIPVSTSLRRFRIDNHRVPGELSYNACHLLTTFAKSRSPNTCASPIEPQTNCSCCSMSPPPVIITPLSDLKRTFNHLISTLHSLHDLSPVSPGHNLDRQPLAPFLFGTLPDHGPGYMGHGALPHSRSNLDHRTNHPGLVRQAKPDGRNLAVPEVIRVSPTLQNALPFPCKAPHLCGWHNHIELVMV